MAQGNKAHIDDVIVAIESEENSSLGTTAQGYPYGTQDRYTSYQPPRYHYQEPEGPPCFLGETSVQLRDGSTRAMKDLKPGGWVQVAKPDGRIGYSPILCMLHREPDEKATFRQIYVQGKKEPISLTPNHLIYATKNPQGSLGLPIFAKDVKEGMVVFVAAEESEKVVPAKVREVSEIELCGFVAPLTQEGTIMADGVAASCYADFDHELSHKAFAPFRLLFGLKSAFLGVGKEKEEAKVGIHWYPKALMKVNKFLFHVRPDTAI
ncbi:DHH [Branchiostoma lanceolatum]|uniref:DHH protein n=1 Tax=Branchiostoma lanceolatum TaxID=7740 RepID=A0A8K0ESD9_BRALA|nr:DHH [Branchiostoma lanceolatum]